MHHKLINAFAKAYKLHQSLTINNKLITNLIAVKENITIAYVGRILCLSLVAPDVVKAIVKGKQLRDLKLQDFINKALPDLWDEQRGTLGFTSTYWLKQKLFVPGNKWLTSLKKRFHTGKYHWPNNLHHFKYF
jgi:hypothetical protein